MLLLCLVYAAAAASPPYPSTEVDNTHIKAWGYVQGHYSVQVTLLRPDIQPSGVTQANERRDSCAYLQSGTVEWANAAWDSGVPVADGSDITLPANSKILVGANSFSTNAYGRITIPASSSLIFKDEPINLRTAGITVDGALTIGEDTCRLESKITITLEAAVVAAGSAQDTDSRKAVFVTGTLDIHGQVYGPTWTRLATTAVPTDEWVFVQDLVNWQAGDKIVITTTALKDSLDFTENEEREISEVRRATAAGTNITAIKLTAPLSYTHYGGWEYQAEVGVLSRNIVIRGDANSETDQGTTLACTDSRLGLSTFPCYTPKGYGGHIMISGTSAVARVRAVELYRMGQTNRLGRYPFHFHIMEENGANSYFTDASIHKSFFRCVTIHATDRTTVSQIVSYDAVGHCYFIENGNEEYNHIVYNFGAFIHMIGNTSWTYNAQYYTERDQKQTSSGPDLILPSDATASVYYIPNARNYVNGNVASGGWAGFAFPKYISPIKEIANDDFTPSAIPVLSFNGNSAHSTGFWWSYGPGLYIGGELEQVSPGNLVYSPAVGGVPTCNGVLPVRGFCISHAWSTFSNTKVFLANRGALHWGVRARFDGFETHDVGRSLQIFGHMGISNMYVNCRSNHKPTKYNGCPAAQATQCNPRDYSYWDNFQGFEWYDGGEIHILTNTTFTNCRKEWADCLHCDYTFTFGVITALNEFTPEIMQATRGVTYGNGTDLNNLWFFYTEPITSSLRLSGWIDADGTASLKNKPTIIGSYYAQEWWKTNDQECTVGGADSKMYLCDLVPETTLGSIFLEPPSNAFGLLTTQCKDDLPCVTVGYATPLLRENPTTKGLEITANSRITGVIDQRLGGGWYVRFIAGAPTSLTLKHIQLQDASNNLVLALPYPAGTSFEIWAYIGFLDEETTVRDCDGELCALQFQATNDKDEFRTGHYYNYDATSSVLFLNVVHMLDRGLGASSWDRTRPLEAFTQDGLTITEYSVDYHIVIKADCTPASGSEFCPLDDDLDSVRTLTMQAYIDALTAPSDSTTAADDSTTAVDPSTTIGVNPSSPTTTTAADDSSDTTTVVDGSSDTTTAADDSSDTTTSADDSSDTTTVADTTTAVDDSIGAASTTTEGTAKVSGSMSFVSTVLTKEHIETAATKTLAQKFGVNENQVTVTAVQTRRLEIDARKLAGTWTVSFTITVASSQAAAAVNKASSIQSDTRSLNQAMKTNLQALGVSETAATITVSTFETSSTQTPPSFDDSTTNSNGASGAGWVPSGAGWVPRVLFCVLMSAFSCK